MGVTISDELLRIELGLLADEAAAFRWYDFFGIGSALVHRERAYPVCSH
jgi:hypothetical protein